MKNEIFNGSTVDDCIVQACKKYNLTKADIKYEVIEEKRGIFKKKASIKVQIIDKNNKNKELQHENSNGTIQVLNSKIIVKDPKEGGNNAVIVVPKNINVKIDGKEVTGENEVSSSNIIEIYFHEIEKPERRADISVSSDKMSAYVNITYTNKNIYKLKDTKPSARVVLQEEILRTEKPPIYTKAELLDTLRAANISYGIVEENMSKCTSDDGAMNVLVAQGIKTQDDEDDYIEFKFDVRKKNGFKESKNGRIDFKSIGFVNAVEEGTILAVRHTGKEGHDGKDIYGNETKKKKGKSVKLNVGEGCQIKDDNTVVSVRKGEPVYSGNKISVIAIHEVNSDVDLTTGNIKFVGDVFIHGSVNESMKVESQNNVKIDENVENATVIASGNIFIEKNAIFSTVCGGGEDVFVLKQLEFLNTIGLNIKKLLEAFEQLKNYNAPKAEVSDGQILKVLLEGKFRLIPRLCEKFVSICDMDDSDNIEIINIFKAKIIGMGPLNIKHADELSGIASLCDDKVSKLKLMLSVPVDVSVGYCQNSKIESSGNVFISGKGEYISDISARNNVIFNNENAIARGGVIKAGNEIKCGVVGSIGGVSTRVQTEKNGNIYAEVAYQNTIFAIGNKESVIENPCKDIHVYVDKDDELVVDKLLL
ncbi:MULTISPECIES: flagellar assembly protein A [Clostridium]|uniref:flagellar assembly protein A n=1 Tax=Clostridium TaxID=1485 RepID=UPI0008259C0E|nr:MULTISPECIES: flagellar assembly protein A [Clostridium]PJI09810.1 hypothetical protein CUB90_18895 [Clostridium sp. CT7]